MREGVIFPFLEKVGLPRTISLAALRVFLPRAAPRTLSRLVLDVDLLVLVNANVDLYENLLALVCSGPIILRLITALTLNPRELLETAGVDYYLLRRPSLALIAANVFNVKCHLRVFYVLLNFHSAALFLEAFLCLKARNLERNLLFCANL